MEEKTLVKDILDGIKLELINYQNAIFESENLELRQIFQMIRDENESFQYELLRIAQIKKYYKSAQKVTVTEMELVKSELQELK